MTSNLRNGLIAALAAVAIAGCSGKDGKNGADGATGGTGPQGPAGPVTTTNESCLVCHATTRNSPTAANHALPFAGGYQDTLAISNVVVADNGGGKFQIDFSLANSAGAVTSATSGDIRVFFAEVSSSNGSNFFDRWDRGYERSGQFDFNGDGTNDTSYPFGTFTNLGGGNYRYVSAANISDAPTATSVQRIFFRVGRSGQYTANYTYDFLPASVGVSVANPRDIVPTASCNKCHEARIADHGHGGGYNKTEACVVCHSPLLNEAFYTSAPHDMKALGFDLPTMVHQIHGAITTINDGSGTPAKPNWGVVTYPAQLNDCKVCHVGGAQSDNYKDNPNALACTSCHTFLRFSDSAGYDVALPVCGAAGWTYPNPCKHTGVTTPASTATCATCHDPAYIDTKHDPTVNRSHVPTAVNTPEFDVTMTITPPATGTFYVAGERPTVTVTLTNKSDGLPVSSSFYTSAAHAAGSTSASALAAANLYVYGPRTLPKPVLTAGAAVTPVPRQATSLLLPSTDANVQTDATGFKYQLNAIPAGMTGTYFVRFYAQNYGYVSDTNYVTDSNAFAVIQIGTATADKKVSGDDCKACHGDHMAPFHDARHGVKFDTDQCNSCHDQSGNFGIPLANRVHAIHAANTAGDLHATALSLDWSHVEFPVTNPISSTSGLPTGLGGVKRCSVCHSSGNTQYLANVGEVSCMGCHAGNPGAVDHFRQNGGKY